MSSSVKSCLNILRRTPPQDIDQNLAGLVTLLREDEEATEELLQRIDVPLKSVEDTNAKKKKYIICDHNRDGDSYRSPWTNAYYPPLDSISSSEDNQQNGSGLKPSHHLRALEIHANEVLDSYRELYYGKDNSVSSVYLWDKHGTGTSTSSSDVGNFSGCFLIQNEITTSNDSSVQSGFWNSVHVVDVNTLQKDRKAFYKLTTTIQVSMLPRLYILADDNKEIDGKTKLCGSLTRQVDKLCPVESEACHIINIGKMLEAMETDMRSNIDALYIQKTREVMDCIYSKEPCRTKNVGQNEQKQQHAMLLNQAVLGRGLKKHSA